MMPRRSLLVVAVLGSVLAVVGGACSETAPDAAPPSTMAPPVDPQPNTTEPLPPAVTVRSSTVTWETYAYELTDFNTIKLGSYDAATTASRTFDTWILENEYLEVTLLPDFGGRILSMVYKPTGHELLYRNPVGVPYQIDTGVFYWDWLMVYGGIFPTFPEPEHGKAWFLPWEFEIVEETRDRVTVAMSFLDDLDYPFAPGRYDGDATGLELTYFVTLEAGRAALDTEIVLRNPTARPVSYEYWTTATLAPGSDPSDPKATANTEMVAPVDLIFVPSFWDVVAAQEEPFGLNDVYRFDTLRRFGNWADMGIAYAFPDMGGASFWGAIDHDSGEGIFRVADNSVTPGLKLWTWGYDRAVSTDPYAGPNEARPYVELWAGVTRQFFMKAELAPGDELRIPETWLPSVGLEGVTHANRDYLVHMHVDPDGAITAEIFGMRPNTMLTARLTAGADVVLTESVATDATVPVRLTRQTGSTGSVTLVLTDDAGTTFEAVIERDGS